MFCRPQHQRKHGRSSLVLIDNLRSVVGIVALLCCAWLLSESRRSISWRTVGLGLGLTIVFIVLLLKVPPIRTAFALVHNVVDAVASATRAGTSFVFGYLGGGPLPFELKTPGSEFILAFQALPMALVMSVLTTLLFYWRILPPVIRGFSWLLERTLGVGGAVGLSTAAKAPRAPVHRPLQRSPAREYPAAAHKDPHWSGVRRRELRRGRLPFVSVGRSRP
jgi:CNT family concentrative nucleoside transporter